MMNTVTEQKGGSVMCNMSSFIFKLLATVFSLADFLLLFYTLPLSLVAKVDKKRYIGHLDQCRFLANWTPTPPLSQHWHLGRGRWAVSQKPKQSCYLNFHTKKFMGVVLSAGHCSIDKLPNNSDFPRSNRAFC